MAVIIGGGGGGVLSLPSAVSLSISRSAAALLFIILYNIECTRVKSRILLLPISIAKCPRFLLLLLLYTDRIELSVAVALRVHSVRTPQLQLSPPVWFCLLLSFCERARAQLHRGLTSHAL